MTVLLVASVILLLAGRYAHIERIATLVSVLLAITVVVAAASVFPGVEPLAAGLVPRLTADLQYDEVLPWLGFTLSGAAGLVWYSYWMTAKR